MTAAQAVQWAILLALLALTFIALGHAIPSRAAHILAAISAGVAVILYAIAIAT